MFCPRCGKENTNGPQFCVNCGIELSPSAGTMPASAPLYSGPPENSGYAVASLICGILFFIFPAAVAAIVLGHLSLSDIRKSAGRLKGSGLATAGLVLGYAGLAMIPLFLFIAISNLDSKKAPNEASAVGSLRDVTTAAMVYSSTYGNGFPPSLGAMGGPAGASTPSCENALLIDPILSGGGVGNKIQKAGYIITYVPGQPLAVGASCSVPGVESYTVIAVPVKVGTTGSRGFYVDQSGVIRYSTDGSPPNQNSPALQ
jgi:type IV pilus assembly protein PilA